jgi:hypothetical protein
MKWGCTLRGYCTHSHIAAGSQFWSYSHPLPAALNGESRFPRAKARGNGLYTPAAGIGVALFPRAEARGYYCYTPPEYGTTIESQICE